MKNIPIADALMIAEKLSFDALIVQLEQAFTDASITTPARHHHDYPNPKELRQIYRDLLKVKQEYGSRFEDGELMGEFFNKLLASS